MAVITISREFGTDSEKIAELAAQKLGYEYIGKNLVARLAEKLNISESEVESFIKASNSRLLKLVDKYTCSIVQKVVDHEYGCVDDEKYFPLLGISYRASMEALLMKYEGFVYIYYGVWCAQFEWIYYARAQGEDILQNKYLILIEHYKNLDPL